MKVFSNFEIATIRRTAQNVSPMVIKKNKLKAKIAEMEYEVRLLETQQEQFEQAIKTMTGGFTSEDLIERVIEVTGEDRDGRPVKSTKWVLKYPETVIPSIAAIDGVETTLEDSPITEVGPFVETLAPEDIPTKEEVEGMKEEVGETDIHAVNNDDTPTFDSL